jgi:hypothetical protein
MICRVHSSQLHVHTRCFVSTIIIALFFVLIQSSKGQDTSTTGGELDESLVNRWDTTIDFEGCYKDLLTADRNGDGVIKEREYLSFIQEYGKRICFTTDQLTIQQRSVFNQLSCLCRTNTVAASVHDSIDNGQCCIGNNAQIATASASKVKSLRSPAEQDYLISVCKFTDATIDGSCRPDVADRGTPIIPIIPGDGIIAPAKAQKNGLDWWEWLLIALAALLLFCLGCCCVWKRRKANEQEDEENQVTTKRIDSSPFGKKQNDNTEPLYPEQPIDQSILKPIKLQNEPREQFAVNSNPNIFPVQLRPVNPAMGALAKEVAAKAAGQKHPPDGVVRAKARGNTIGDPDSDDEDVRKKSGGQRIPDIPDEEVLRIIGSPQLLPLNPIPPKPIKLQPIPPKEPDSDAWDHPGRNLEYPVCKDDDSAQVFDPYIPDGGVPIIERPQKEPLDWRKEWHRQYPEEVEPFDNRKHRIQSGLGEGEVWNKLDNDDETVIKSSSNNVGGVFDWVVQSALGALNDTAAATATTTTTTNATFNNSTHAKQKQ